MTDSLKDARSPFLQHGAKQPVKWMPFGEAAFERARAENKPILLDIGAVWCHWCHVMDRESYEDEATAALINELYVPIKVDRDERPDVDARYQRAVQTLTGQGGWPLTAFLTPDGETYYGGTYFPPHEAYGRPSFKRVLSEVARVWRDEPGRARDAVAGIRDRLAQYAKAETESGAPAPELVTHTVEEFAQTFDFRWGGFGRAPKFPNTGALALLTDHYCETNTEWSWRIVAETLGAMARGGIYDQLGGGFHRYATDARWLVPHFEKMAYDNGPLLEVYARAYAVSSDALFLEIVNGIVAHYEDIAGDLIADGGFPASQDADYSSDDDGDYWTWTEEELRAALTPEEAEAAIAYYGLEDSGSSMHLDPRRHVLYRAQREPNDLVRNASLKLKRVRDGRPEPYIDTTVYSGWCALVATGFLAAARHCQHATAGQHALRALERIWREAFVAGRGVSHRVGDNEAGEYLEDQAFVVQAFLDAFESTQDEQWLERARILAELTVRLYQDPVGAFRDRPRGAAAAVGALDEAHYPIADAPTQSGNAVMALNLLRLSALLHDDAWRDRAEAIITAFAGSAARLSTSAATYVRALDWFTKDTTSVVVVGKGAAAQDVMFQEAARAYRPRMVLRYFESGSIDAERLPVELRAMVTSDAPRAYVCAGRSCAAPVDNAEALRELIQTFR